MLLPPMNGRVPRVAIVRSCLRDGRGGSTTAVVEETPLSDDERRRIPLMTGASHAVFVAAGEGRAALRFFTAEGELPACGHGTIAALAFLAGNQRFRGVLRTAAGAFTGWSQNDGGQLRAGFETGPVEFREPRPQELRPVLAALGIAPDDAVPGASIASIGRERMLVPLGSRSALAALEPDFTGLRAVCDRLGLLGCYVYSRPDSGSRLAARMFAPSIGVEEDIANANSTACLAALLAGQGLSSITVDMGDALGSPAAITAAAPAGSRAGIRLGGTAIVSSRDTLAL
ncbi:PhzF family phenazine biosynthesis protein [Promicromonospora sp. NPDC057138]|uniref:PhzF family phenazine biosynthesis protein n=1 Tax=Promicromonospora sp. NPDC057138 TaxID=3346031 RepID=UPI003635D98E